MTQKLLGNLSRGLIFVLSAPAGTGKTTLVQKLCREFLCVEASVSSTTRAPRAGEKEGFDYYFLSHEMFEKKIQEGDFLEYAEVFGQWYGTSSSQVQSIVDKGHHVILVIDTQGALQLQKINFSAVYIFITPPSLEVLEDRLYKRQSEEISKQKERLSWAEQEMKYVVLYDYLIVNDNIEVAYNVLRSILIAEENRVRKN